jgi:hypothetical protein
MLPEEICFGNRTPLPLRGISPKGAKIFDI